MSRNANAQQKKKEQKALMAATREKKADLLSQGLNSTMKKIIEGDTLLCISCGATCKGHGGETLKRCICKGGNSKPPSDFDTTPLLITAGKARWNFQQSLTRLENVKVQCKVQDERNKKRDEKNRAEEEGNDDIIQEEYCDEYEMSQTFEFAIGKLGFDVERNCVARVIGGSQAEDLGIKAGWVIWQIGSCGADSENKTKIDDTGNLKTKFVTTLTVPSYVSTNGDITADDTKKKILLAITKEFKQNKPCKIKFRCPIKMNEPDVKRGPAVDTYCYKCDKFKENENGFSDEQIEKSIGQRTCVGCEELEGYEF